MTKVEFLEHLRKELTGNISQRAVQDNIDYYDRYIIDEVKSGKSEKEVLQMLGDPWVIAQTIIEASDSTGTDDIYEESTGSYSYGAYSQDRKKEKSSWWKTLLLVLFIIMIIMCVLAIITGVIRLVAPILFPVAVVMLIIRFIKGGRS